MPSAHQSQDVFVDDITHVLIICTASRLTLLGLSRPSGRELNLYHTNMSVGTPTAMLHIAGTTSGRVFMRGGNKDLYELEYSSESRWFFGSGARVGITNRSSGNLSTWMPSIMSSNSKAGYNLQSMFADYVGREGIENFVIDSAQSRLFTLHTKGAIEMFDISSTQFLTRGRYSNLRNDLISRGIAGNASNNAQTNVVHLAVVGASESRRACLVAVTAYGEADRHDEADVQALVCILLLHRLPLSVSAVLRPIP